MENRKPIFFRNTIDMQDNTIRLDDMERYRKKALATEVKGIDENTQVTMRHGNLTIFVNKNGQAWQTTRLPENLLSDFCAKNGVVHVSGLRQTMNHLTQLNRKFPGIVTPRYTFSKIDDNHWVNLNLVTSFRTLKTSYFRTLICFANGGSLEVATGVKSVRNTFLWDTLESISLKHIFNIPIEYDVIDYQNHYGKTPYVTDLMWRLISKKKRLLFNVELEEFIKTLTVFTTLLPQIKKGIFDPNTDCHVLDHVTRQILSDILNKQKGDGDAYL